MHPVIERLREALAKQKIVRPVASPARRYVERGRRGRGDGKIAFGARRREHEHLQKVLHVRLRQVGLKIAVGVIVSDDTLFPLTPQIDRVACDCGDLAPEIAVAVRLQRYPDRRCGQNAKGRFASIGKAGGVAVNLVQGDHGYFLSSNVKSTMTLNRCAAFSAGSVTTVSRRYQTRLTPIAGPRKLSRKANANLCPHS